MKAFLAVSALITVASAGIAPIIIIPSSKVARGPVDSAIVQSERLGNGFAYSVVEGQGIESVAAAQSLGVLTPWDTLPLITTLTGQPILWTTAERISESEEKTDKRIKTATDESESEPVDVSSDEARDKTKDDLTDKSREDRKENKTKDDIKAEPEQRTVDSKENTREQLKEWTETEKRERITKTNEKTRKHTAELA